MNYTVTLNYTRYNFDDIKDAVTFAQLARRSNPDITVEIEFNTREDDNNDEN